MLYVWGELTKRDHNAIGVVGSRHATMYGMNATKKLSFQIAYAGYTVISGLVSGTDIDEDMLTFTKLVGPAHGFVTVQPDGSFSARVPAGVTQALQHDWSHSTAPDYVETLAELAMQMPVADTGSAYVAASRATELDSSRAFAWAQLAYLETRRASGKVNEASLNALTRSMDACPLCDDTLIGWRLNFVLANWTAIPEPLRKRAFEQADVLRWIGPNAEFLAEMRIKARQNGIPFDAYRAAVNTPARTWDIGPVTVEKATKIASSH